MVSIPGNSPYTTPLSSNKLPSSKNVSRGLSANVVDDRGEEIDHKMTLCDPLSLHPHHLLQKKISNQQDSVPVKTKARSIVMQRNQHYRSYRRSFSSFLVNDRSLRATSATDRGPISFQVCHKKWGRKRKVDECTPNSLALSQTPSARETLANVNSSPLLRSSLAELPAIPSCNSPPGHSEPSKGTTLNDNHDYSSDGWLDIDTIFPDAGLELSHCHLEATPEEMEEKKPRDSPTRSFI